MHFLQSMDFFERFISFKGEDHGRYSPTPGLDSHFDCFSSQFLAQCFKLKLDLNLIVSTTPQQHFKTCFEKEIDVQRLISCFKFLNIRVAFIHKYIQKYLF